MKNTLLLFILFVLFACETKHKASKKTAVNSEIKSNFKQNDSTLYYLFLGHIYDKQNIIDKRIKNKKNEIKFFNQIWLGGDIALDAGLYQNLFFIDSIFSIKSNRCHWAFGNHDITATGVDSICNYINRPPYYATYINGVTLLVYNTNYNSYGTYNEIDAQTDFMLNICDTIKESSHLILLSHQGAWINENKNMVKKTANTYNDRYLFYSNPKSMFNDIIYPKLTEVQKKGIQVILLAGDFGQKQSTFEYLSNDSIYFLGNGIISKNQYNSKFKKWNNNDSILIFQHIPKSKKLTWNFINIGD